MPLEKEVLDAARFDPAQRELLEITWRLLHAIDTGDAETYAALSSPELSCFEDVCAYRIDGLEFHLDLIRSMAKRLGSAPLRFDMLSPRVQIYGDCGIVTYTRLQTFEQDGMPHWKSYNETRVFVKQNGAWKLVHFHRSPTR
ncbi:protein with protein kinase II-like association domain [Chthonomonas calidirosea]|uniref:Calcium/calmodulin dependent protein kinase II Association n=1 Tax=Chthonomonas calidirosea (strain DSM 23976 / ICMP 18418 / T49) TaxID=1303518 RepID=S0ES34_CHTCT|nr:nuclear transport factor 2 family protein [Chthonomonas calidirosea]CCW33896.1 Calcium/calmodulin dependent protein kinase II Association [Chthonomonas calidirosea T49]CEK16344.1 protein with protein kinase II-like association domain [Chthonomonas calidirosea]